MRILIPCLKMLTSFNQILDGTAWINLAKSIESFGTDGAYIPVILTLDADGRLTQTDFDKAIENWDSQKQDDVASGIFPLGTQQM